MTLVAPGTCRFCGCHGESCTRSDGDKCWWANSTSTLCSAEACLRAEAERARRAKAALPPPPRRPNRFDIWDEQKQRRNRRRRKGKAA